MNPPYTLVDGAVLMLQHVMSEPITLIFGRSLAGRPPADLPKTGADFADSGCLALGTGIAFGLTPQ